MSLELRVEGGRRRTNRLIAEASRTRIRAAELRKESRRCREQSARRRRTLARRLFATRRRFERTIALRRALLHERHRVREQLAFVCRRTDPADLLQPELPPLCAWDGPASAKAGELCRKWRGTGARAPSRLAAPDRSRGATRARAVAA